MKKKTVFLTRLLDYNPACDLIIIIIIVIITIIIALKLSLKYCISFA